VTQTWNAAEYQATGNFVPTLGEPLVDLLNPQPGMRILDVGCGNGTLTLKLMERGATVVGIDASADMVQAACRKGVDARTISAYDLTFENEFDAVFSNAALHWMTDHPAKVLENIANALKPGGRFVAEMGGEGNIAHIREAERQALNRRNLDLETVAPLFFPSKAQYQSMLEAAGFTIEQIELFPRKTRLPDGLANWLRVFSTAVLSSLPADDVEPFIQEVETLARPYLTDDEGWFADYVRLRFSAHKA
jgi:trans-aconitate methyltransferase